MPVVTLKVTERQWMPARTLEATELHWKLVGSLDITEDPCKALEVGGDSAQVLESGVETTRTWCPDINQTQTL